jgi:hypothetical protein
VSKSANRGKEPLVFPQEILICGGQSAPSAATSLIALKRLPATATKPDSTILCQYVGTTTQQYQLLKAAVVVLSRQTLPEVIDRAQDRVAT